MMLMYLFLMIIVQKKQKPLRLQDLLHLLQQLKVTNQGYAKLQTTQYQYLPYSRSITIGLLYQRICFGEKQINEKQTRTIYHVSTQIIQDNKIHMQYFKNSLSAECWFLILICDKPLSEIASIRRVNVRMECKAKKYKNIIDYNKFGFEFFFWRPRKKKNYFINLLCIRAWELKKKLKKNLVRSINKVYIPFLNTFSKLKQLRMIFSLKNHRHYPNILVENIISDVNQGKRCHIWTFGENSKLWKSVKIKFVTQTHFSKKSFQFLKKILKEFYQQQYFVYYQQEKITKQNPSSFIHSLSRKYTRSIQKAE